MTKKIVKQLDKLRKQRRKVSKEIGELRLAIDCLKRVDATIELFLNEQKKTKAKTKV